MFAAIVGRWLQQLLAGGCSCRPVVAAVGRWFQLGAWCLVKGCYARPRVTSNSTVPWVVPRARLHREETVARNVPGPCSGRPIGPGKPVAQDFRVRMRQQHGEPGFAGARTISCGSSLRDGVGEFPPHGQVPIYRPAAYVTSRHTHWARPKEVRPYPWSIHPCKQQRSMHGNPTSFPRGNHNVAGVSMELRSETAFLLASLRAEYRRSLWSFTTAPSALRRVSATRALRSYGHPFRICLPDIASQCA